ncbi:hypothetical protein [Plantactinospora mayteni]|uniref:hypothetical protein n=1 Tax=Plantactinospora mayteni TaxID=566021 RepID=UPI00194301C6|nr:hypothetical protein [Plantactinospora mayteni]
MRLTLDSEELDPPETLWIRGAVRAVDDAALGAQDVKVDDDGLEWNGPDGIRKWRLILIEGNRALLYGHHVFDSHTLNHKPAIDLLADCPKWLPVQRLRSLMDETGIGFVYWWVNGAWRYSDYPGEFVDDGLYGGVQDVTSDQFIVDYGSQDRGRLTAFLERAKRRDVDEAAVEALFSGSDRADVAAALACARRAGLVVGSVLPYRPVPRRRPR